MTDELKILKAIAKATERIELQLCGPREPRKPMTEAELEAWTRVLQGGFRPRGAEPGEEAWPPPAGGTLPEEFWARPDPEVQRMKRKTRSERSMKHRIEWKSRRLKQQAKARRRARVKAEHQVMVIKRGQP